MKIVPGMILAIVVAALLLQPMTEFAILMEEKVKLGSSMSNAMEVAKRESLVYEDMRQLDAVIDEEQFADNFAEVFAEAIGVYLVNESDDILTFHSDGDSYSSVTVELSFIQNTDAFSNRTTTMVKAISTSDYNFKTKLLQMAESSGEDVGYQMVSERECIISVMN